MAGQAKTQRFLATEFWRTQRDYFRHGLTQFVSTSPPMSRSLLCSKQRLCSKRAFVPAGLLCPQAEKQPLLKENTVTAPFLTVDRVLRTGTRVLGEFLRKMI